ncbi:MAG: hypothetical protein GYB66_11965 [Chloroflexi bacterium]|nr:hypothetical protein [Chloroflexota bacterium]
MRAETNSQPAKPIPGLWAIWLLPVVFFGFLVSTLSSQEAARKWLADEGAEVFSWWLLVTLAGVAVFPLLFRLLPALPDRGYSLARTAGLLLVGVVFWFLASIGLLQNAPESMALAWMLVLMASILAWTNWTDRPSWAEVAGWLREQTPLIVVTEVLFLVAFVAWAYVQAHNPEIHSTEKPMEMAFINGVRNSATFPPQDPWLSGYAISYYYFGYVMTASLADLSAVPTGMAFNLVTALLFALTATGAFGVGYNLVRGSGPLKRWRTGNQHAALGTGLLAATFVVLSGNLGTVLIELPYNGYTSDTPVLDSVVDREYFDYWDVVLRSRFYEPVAATGGRTVRLLDTGETMPFDPQQLDNLGYVRLPDRDSDNIPNWNDDRFSLRDDAGFWWWFRYSRVIRDRDLAGQHAEPTPIAEVPSFSFILTDNHPHVLGLPFTLLMIGLAIGLALRRDPLQLWEIIVYGILVGGMIFANAWDAVYLVVIVAAEALRRLVRNGTGKLTGWDRLIRVVSLQTRVEQNILLAGPVFLAVLVLILLLGVGDINSGFWPLDLLLQIAIAAVVAVPATLIVNWLLDDSDWAGIARLAIGLLVVFYLFYLPWLESFSSQASGFYPNIIHPTKYQQFFLQFGIFGLLIAPLIIREALRGGSRINWVLVWTIVFVALFIILTIPVLSAIFINWQCPLEGGENWGQVDSWNEWSCQARGSLFGNYDNSNVTALAGEVLVRRFTALPTQLLALLAIGIITMRFFARPPRESQGDSREPLNFSPATGVALLIIAAGLVAAIMPDVVYLRDNFSTRINTVFKLYYQAWVLLSIGSAYAFYSILSGPNTRYAERPRLAAPSALVGRWLYAVGGVVLLTGGLLYPFFAVPQRAIHETDRSRVRACEDRGEEECDEERPLTLDGSDTLVWAGRNWSITPAEYAVMQCLAEKEPRKSDAILVEATGGGYTPELGRFSMYTGIPTVLGWDNHERQWRGLEGFFQTIDGNARIADVERLYSLLPDQWSETERIIRKYGIDYIVVGEAEIRRYSTEGASLTPNLAKFDQLLDPVCQEGNVAVYRVSPE